MELTLMQRHTIVVSLTLRIAQILENLKVTPNDDFWIRELEEANDAYRVFMGIDASKYAEFKELQNAHYVVHHTI